MDRETVIEEVDADTVNGFLNFCSVMQISIRQGMMMIINDMLKKSNPEDTADFLRELADTVERGNIREV